MTSYVLMALGGLKTNGDGHLHYSRRLKRPYLQPTSASDHHRSQDWKRPSRFLHLKIVPSCSQSADSSTLAAAGRKAFVGWEEKHHMRTGRMGIQKWTLVSDPVK